MGEGLRCSVDALGFGVEGLRCRGFGVWCVIGYFGLRVSV